MASVAMAQFTIVPWSPATQVKTFANIAKHYDLNWRIEMTQSGVELAQSGSNLIILLLGKCLPKWLQKKG